MEKASDRSGKWHYGHDCMPVSTMREYTEAEHLVSNRLKLEAHGHHQVCMTGTQLNVRNAAVFTEALAASVGHH